MAKLSLFRQLMLGRGSYLVNYLERICRRTEKVQPERGRRVSHPYVLCKRGIPQTRIESAFFAVPAGVQRMPKDPPFAKGLSKRREGWGILKV
jgi:hypothetical protein